LAKWIVQSLDDLSEAESEALWAKEAERRLDELEQGVAAEIPAEEALHRAQAAISWSSSLSIPRRSVSSRRPRSSMRAVRRGWASRFSMRWNERLGTRRRSLTTTETER